jgi:tRNA A37 N6-isopentenylltransferase MiaA
MRVYVTAREQHAQMRMIDHHYLSDINPQETMRR